MMLNFELWVVAVEGNRLVAYTVAIRYHDFNISGNINGNIVSGMISNIMGDILVIENIIILILIFLLR